MRTLSSLMWLATACADPVEPGTDRPPSDPDGPAGSADAAPHDTSTEAGRPSEPQLRTLLAASGAGDDVFLHPDGYLVASDPVGDGTLGAPTGSVLRRIDLDGHTEVYASGLTRPLGNSIGEDGRVYAVEWGGRGRVFAVATDRTVTVLTEGLSYASNVVAHPDGSLYVTAWGDDHIARIDPDSGARSVWRDGVDRPVGLALDLDGESLLVSSFSHGAVSRIGMDGSVSTLATLPANPSGVAADLVATPSGVYVTGFGCHCIYRVDEAGDVTVVAGTGEPGSTDGPATEATLREPNGIARSADGRTLYIQELGGGLRVLEL